jgi:glycine dehydrogenase
VVVACDAEGNVDLDDLEAKARAHRADLAAIMVTYPSTHGVFEEGITRTARSSTPTVGRCTSTART